MSGADKEYRPEWEGSATQDAESLGRALQPRLTGMATVSRTHQLQSMSVAEMVTVHIEHMLLDVYIFCGA